MAPVVQRLRAKPARFRVRCCSTNQHRDLLRPVLDAFSIVPDYELDGMSAGQTLGGSTARILAALDPVLAADDPDLVIVQGDTTTTLCGSLAGFYAQVPVAHVEAGLRTYDMTQPFPEEMNRVLTSRVASLHFAATPGAFDALRQEGITAGVTIRGTPASTPCSKFAASSNVANSAVAEVPASALIAG